MKSIAFYSILALFIINNSKAQCPSGNLTFTSQQAIEDFVMEFPNCSAISGNLEINDTPETPIYDLTDLQNLKTVFGDLLIIDNSTLKDIGLPQLKRIGGKLEFSGNDSLTHISGLNNLSSLKGDLIIGYSITSKEPEGNYALTKITGLQDLSTVEGGITIAKNLKLIELSGLQNLKTIEGSLSLGGLHDISGLQNLNSIGGGLDITGSRLTNLLSLQNLKKIGENGGVSIQNNSALVDLSGLENLTTINGRLNIRGNDALISLSGLNNLRKISILYIRYNIVLTDLSALKNISTMNELVLHSNISLSSLKGLENLNSTNWSLSILDNKALNNLSDLKNLTEVGELYLNHTALADLSGLENLNTIHSDLTIYNNDMLNDLSGLEGLNKIGQKIEITSNDNLTDLFGLQNITNNFEELKIANNPILSSCNAKSICTYLAKNGVSTINKNAEGCNNLEDILESCKMVAVENEETSIIQIYPNPSAGTFTIKGIQLEKAKISLYGITGKCISETIITNQNPKAFQLKNVACGVYFVYIEAKEKVIRRKLIVTL